MGRLRSSLLTQTGRPRTPWRLLLAGVLFALVNIAVTAVFLLLGAPLVEGLDVSGPGLAVVMVMFVVNGIALSVAALYAARYIDARQFSDLGFRFDSYWWPDLIAGGTLGVVLIGGAYAGGVAVGVYQPRLAPTGPAGYSVLTWLGLVVAMMVAVGVYEELLLRGYVLTNLAEGFTVGLSERTAVVGALLVSSLGFGVLHGTNPNATALGVVTIALAGLLLGLGYVFTGSLAFPIGVHITWNLTHILLNVPVSGLELGIYVIETETSGPTVLHGGSFGPEGGILGLIATLVGCLTVVGYARLTGRWFRADIAVPALRGDNHASDGSPNKLQDDVTECEQE